MACSVIPVMRRNEGEREGLNPHMTCKGKNPLHSCPILLSSGIKERHLSYVGELLEMVFLTKPY
jgi:hypothetical protein